MKDLGQLTYFLGLEVHHWKDEGDLFADPTIYWRLVRSLIYLTTTRPDISYAIHQVSWFMSSCRHLHFAAICHIIRYIIGSPTRGAFISWKCKKQDHYVSKSSTEAEYRSMSSTCSEIVWLRSLLEELGFHNLTLPLFMLIIQVLFKLLQIPCSTNVPNISRLIATISGKP
uniref:Reverse transcriptase Ty1/copia-type domain-containing protein n=1 Tax=Cajanus cajan TaxID=3821 RepID=A0A151TMQ1_CAJCA|nr:hypothetical protein KK1_021944 [Cajanus cajan]